MRFATANLVTALRSPVKGGRWGEIHLRRVCELAGMLPHCDFVEQVKVGDDEQVLRPDLIVQLPGARNVVVDSKVPVSAYLDSLNADSDEARDALLAAFGKSVRDHMGRLSSKAYWEQFEQAPEFVVMFLPSEAFFSAALEQVSDLIEQGVRRSVIIATPTTLVALLRAVA